MFKEQFDYYHQSFDRTKLYFATNFDIGSPEDRPILLFNYGLVCNFAHWEMQLKHFDELGYQIIIHDYRGHFNSAGNDNIPEITFENIVKDIDSFLLKYNLKDIVLFGHSMGVNICLEYLKNYPERCRSMILIGGTVFPPHDIMFDSQGMNIVFPAIKFAFKKFPEVYDFIWKTGGFNPIARHLVHSGGFNINEVSKEFVQVYINRIGKLKPGIFIKLLEEMRDHQILSFLEHIKIPTLIIGGEKDKVIPFKLQQLIHQKIESSQLYIVKEGSHVPQVDFPNSVNERIELFLSRY